MMMRIGIQKRQLCLLLLALAVPLLLNAVAIWEDIGTDSILKMWNGSYPNPFGGFLGGAYNPLPEIALGLLPYVATLGLLAWLVVFISTRTFFQKQPRVAKFGETLLMVLLVAVIFTFVTGFLMPLIWLPKLHDYRIGLPGSSFMEYWVVRLVLPTTILILLGAVFISENTTPHVGN
jgi:hypothetical protein